MYTFLDSLERIIADEGQLPDTVYHQIDGGSENTAYAWFALCEIIVARRLCKKLVLTRLMVGHTHEDIDSKFGILWKRIRSRFVLTPQQYQTEIEKALSSEKQKCAVVDVFAVPDFKTLLDKHVDPKLNAQTKLEKTQLQWTFEAVTPDEYFANGVRVFYRAFAAEEVVQIIEDPSKPCGVEAKKCDVFDYPMKDVARGIMVDGMTVLTSIPTQKPLPFPFVKGSREVLDAVILKVRGEFQRCQPAVVQQWTDWAKDCAPASDSVEEYLDKKPLHCPLGDILFGNAPVDPTPVPEDKDGIGADLQRMRTTDCVKWARWGHKREDHSVENHARVERVLGANGVPVEVSALPAKLIYFRPWAKRKEAKPDEKGDFKFVLGRADPKDLFSPLTTQGQAIELRDGGWRVYWKHKRAAEVFPVDDINDRNSLLFKLDIGWICYGCMEPPLSGLGKVGVPVFHNAAGHVVAARPAAAVLPVAGRAAAPPAVGASASSGSGAKKRRRRRQVRRSEEEEESEMEDEEDEEDEEESEVEEEEEEEGSESDSDSDSESDSESAIQLFKVGEKIRNCHNLNGVVTKYSEGRYDVSYNNGQVDWNMKQSQLRPPVVKSGRKVNNRGSWSREVVAVNNAWVDRGGLVAENVISGSRRRGSSSSSSSCSSSSSSSCSSSSSSSSSSCSSSSSSSSSGRKKSRR